MSIESERERLLQKHNLERIRQEKATDMVTVYRQMESPRDYFIFCALIPPDQIEQELSETNVGKRYGTESGIEQLIIPRCFGGIREKYNEISEEFRLFHNLYHDRKTDTYIKIDEVGNEETIAIVKPDEVKIRLKEIRKFLAVKEMYLSILFEFNEYSRYSLEELGLNDVEREFKRDDLICWRHDCCDHTAYREFLSDSRLRGRRLIKPLPKSKSGLGDFAEERKYVEFIVDTDENGDDICYTCDPSELSDVPGENAAWKLTLVHFDKRVLNKYYNEPSKYTVEASMVECASLWSMKIDNDDPSKVCVFLDELGISLPHAEQEHWRVHNIQPKGGMSETFYRRMILGEWANSDQPDILFKQSYEQLQMTCEEHLDWQVLKPLSSGDEYRFQRLRIPVNDEQCHFDDLVQDLQTILIESINVKGLKSLMPVAEKANLKDKRSIEILEEVLSFCSVGDTDRQVSFLQKLQALRSAGSGHRKGSNYQKIAKHFEVDSLGQQEAFIAILKQALDTVDFLISVVQSGKLGGKSERSS